jgi:hypothetical protein
MRIISKGRTCAKTFELLAYSSLHRARICCISQEECDHLSLMAKQSNIDIPKPLPWYDVYTKIPNTDPNPKIIVENADCILNKMLGANVIAITVTGDVEVA